MEHKLFLSNEQKNISKEISKIVKDFGLEYVRKYTEPRKYGMFVKFYHCDPSIYDNKTLTPKLWESIPGIIEIVKNKTPRETSLVIKIEGPYNTKPI